MERNKRLIRIDDFPCGDKRLLSKFKADNLYHEILKFILDLFNKWDIQYILGVSPLLLTDEDIDFLNEYVHVGNVVMHGFDHGFSGLDWDNVIQSWPSGGEYSNLSEDEIAAKYNICHDILYSVKKVDTRHFIPPFNCYNQLLLNVLNDKSDVLYIHTCDQEYYKYQLDTFSHGHVRPVISDFGKTYADVDKIDLSHPSQVTLHWTYDYMDVKDWKAAYRKFCKALYLYEKDKGSLPYK